MSPEAITTFRLHGEQTVRTIAEAHRALADFVAAAPAIAIDLSAVTDADVTLVQLIEAARTSALQDGKRICLSGPLPDSLRDVLVRGGFINSPEATMFWTSP